jgi:cell division protein ZapB
MRAPKAFALYDLHRIKAPSYTLGMQNELNLMLDKVERLAQAVKELREENAALAARLAAAEHDNQSLVSRLAAARDRVNTLLDKLPGA